MIIYDLVWLINIVGKHLEKNNCNAYYIFILYK